MKTRIKSGATVQVIEAPSREEAEASFKEEFKGREYVVIEDRVSL